MTTPHDTSTPTAPRFKIITFEAHREDDSTRAQHEIETLMGQGWTLIRATTPPGAPSIVLLERSK